MRYDINRLLKIARALKAEHYQEGCFHVSYIYKGPKLMSIGINSYKDSHPRKRLRPYLPTKTVKTKNYNPVLHSEVAAAKQLDFKCDGMTLFNVRLLKNGEMAYSAPCLNCWETIVKPCGFKRIYFTTGTTVELLKI